MLFEQLPVNIRLFSICMVGCLCLIWPLWLQKLEVQKNGPVRRTVRSSNCNAYSRAHFVSTGPLKLLGATVDRQCPHHFILHARYSEVEKHLI